MANDSGTLTSSGSSLNIPTGSGSERLRRASIEGLNDGTQEILSGTAGHIYTILSVIFRNGTATATYGIGMTVNVGSQNIQLISDNAQKVEAYGTFVFNDKFVMEEDDDLDVYNQVSNGDWYISYIDQDWT